MLPLDRKGHAFLVSRIRRPEGKLPEREERRAQLSRSNLGLSELVAKILVLRSPKREENLKSWRSHQTTNGPTPWEANSFSHSRPKKLKRPLSRGTHFHSDETMGFVE